MKKHVSILILVLGLFFVTISKAQAQYPIPSYQVELENTNTTFEDNDEVELLSPLNLEEIKLVIQVSDTLPAQASWVTVIVYSLDGQDELGPYTVTEGTPLEVIIDERLWGVRVTSYSEGAYISVWIE